tara:strand:- start:1268 stop:1474 length:207 start_codon:yes stop_codon:yes gene_type:complete
MTQPEKELLQFKQYQIEALQKEVEKQKLLIEGYKLAIDGYKLVIDRYKKNEKFKHEKNGNVNRELKES